jgi:hypothetical protein
MSIRGDWNTREVFVDNQRLDPYPSQQISNHSPDGFNWGYGGSGPAQLALGLLLHFVKKADAVKNYQQFKWDIVAQLPQADFEIPTEQVKDWIKKNVKEAIDAEVPADGQ